MTLLIILLVVFGVVWLLALALVWALCRAAARGDRG